MTDKRTELKGKEKFLAGLTSFLEKNKTILFILLGVIVAAIIVVAVIDSVTDKRANASAERIEAVQKDFDDWMVLEDDDSEKPAKQQALLDELDGVISDYSATYAAQRAFYLKGGIYFQNENWAAAAVSLSLILPHINSESYLSHRYIPDACSFILRKRRQNIRMLLRFT